MSYQVYIEGLKTAGTVQAVAAAIGQRYGLPAAALAQRMAQGRFRVKQGVDLETAKTFARDLDSLGALASVVDEIGQVVVPAAPSDEPLLDLMDEAAPISAQFPAQDDPLAAAAPVAKPPPSDNPFAGITAKSSAAPSDTGLAAATGAVQQDLGALSSGDALLSIAALDGPEEAPSEKPAASFAPPSSTSAFLPPGAEQEVDIQIDAASMPARPSQVMAPPDAAASFEEANTGGANASLGEGRVDKAGPLRRLFDVLDADARLRFAVGVLAITLLAFLPAHLYGSMSENTAYSKMRSDLRQTQALVEDPTEWEALAEIRAGVAEQMDKRRINIAITAGLIWLVMAGGLGFLYFRKLPWEHLGPRIAKGPEPAQPPRA